MNFIQTLGQGLSKLLIFFVIQSFIACGPEQNVVIENDFSGFCYVIYKNDINESSFRENGVLYLKTDNKDDIQVRRRNGDLVKIHYFYSSETLNGVKYKSFYVASSAEEAFESDVWNDARSEFYGRKEREEKLKFIELAKQGYFGKVSKMEVTTYEKK